MLSLSSDKTSLPRYQLSNANIAAELRKELNFAAILTEVKAEAIELAGCSVSLCRI